MKTTVYVIDFLALLFGIGYVFYADLYILVFGFNSATSTRLDKSDHLKIKDFVFYKKSVL